MASKFFVLGCLLLGTTIGAYAEEPEKLMGATRAGDGEFPYMAAIVYNGNFHCGGAIVRSDLILTAAHCVDPLINDPTAEVFALTGSNNLRRGMEFHEVVGFYKHPKWTTGNAWGYDVGFLRLAKPISFNAKQKPISITSTPPPAPGSKVMVSAWGLNGYPNGVIPDNMDKLQLTVVGQQECQRKHKYYITDLQICTYRAPGVGTCQGDSGSPLVHNGQVIGVVSGGIPCAKGIPDVFTNLYKVHDFIDYVFSL